MGEELVVHGGGLDQPLPVSQDALDEMYSAVDELVRDAIEHNDPMQALDGARELIKGVQLRGVALMRLLYKLNNEWAKFGLSETFADRIFDELGLSKRTLLRYLDIWTAVFENENVPKQLLPPLAEKPVNTLRRLIRPVNENKLVDEKDWKRIANAEDDTAVRKIIEELSGRSNRGRPALKLLLYQDGRLVVALGDETAVLAVVRNSPEDLKNKLRMRGLERLRNGSGVLDV